MNNIRLYMHVATVTLMNLIHVQTCIAKKGGAHAPPCTPPWYRPGPTRLVPPCCRGRVLGLFCNPGSLSWGLMLGLFVGSCRKEELVESLGLWHSFCQLTLRGCSMSHALPPIVFETPPKSFLFSELGGSAPYWWRPPWNPTLFQYWQ